METTFSHRSHEDFAVPSALSPLAQSGLCIALAFVYFISAKLGLRLAFVHQSATAVWPPSGIALAALLLFGYRCWPGVLLGAFVANVTTTGSIPACLAIATGNTLEALSAYYLTCRWAGGRRAFYRTQDVLHFLGLAAIASTLLAATIGTGSLWLGGLAATAKAPLIWLTWWLGDAAGVMIAAPFLLLWANDWRIRWSRLQYVEAAMVVVSVLLISRVVFAGWQPDGKNHPSSYLLWPILTWAALRFGPRETASVSLLISGFGLYGTLHGYGPFSRESPNENLLVLQLFLSVANAMSLVLAADVEQRRQAEQTLTRTREDLESRVMERTATLLKVNADLLTEVREREKAEEEVRRLAAIVAYSDAAILSTDLDGAVRTWNPGAQKLFGYFPSEMIGKSETELVPDDPELQKEAASIYDSLKLGEARQLETKRRRKNGAVIDVLITASPIKDPHGRTVACSAVMRDISVRKRMEEDLRQMTEQLMHSNAELNLFASAVSHELQEPVRKIVGFGDLIDTSKTPKAELTDYVNRMKSAAKRMQRLIDGLLSLSRVTTQARPVESVDLKAVLEDAIADLRDSIESEGGSIEIGTLPTVQGDALQLRQLFQNLAGNAFKFRKKKEPLHLRITAGAPSNGFIDISVVDNGIGFEQQDARRIFEPFQRLNRRGEYEGSGLGLAICERIALRHGGEIRAKSSPGDGSTFIVTLPA